MLRSTSRRPKGDIDGTDAVKPFEVENWGDMVEVLLWKRTLREGMNDFTDLGSKVVNA
jgi:hypothetical protein